MTSQTEKCPWCGSEISHAKFAEITAKIRQEEKDRLRAKEDAIRAKYDEQLRSCVEQERRKATLAGQKEITELHGKITQLTSELNHSSKREAELTKQIEKREEQKRKLELNEQREILDREYEKEIAKQRSDFNREREATQRKVMALERQLKKQTANDLGDGGEIDLFEALREEFPNDRIRRVSKGEAGADIHHEVIHKGEVCGLIVLDSKNRQAWQRSFASKLREDRINAKADHAVLATTVFPAGKKELCVEESIIVVNPQRAVHIVTILRTALIRMHSRGLTLKERDGKMEELYRYITSDEYAQKLAETGRLTNELLEIDVHEQKEHQNVWKKRGRALTRLKNLQNDLESEVSSIVEGTLQAVGANADSF